MREETHERIMQAIRDLNYQPNVQAQGLRLQRTKTMAFLTIDPAVRFLSDPFHVAILSGMVDTLRQEDYGLLVQGFHRTRPAACSAGWRISVGSTARSFTSPARRIGGRSTLRSWRVRAIRSSSSKTVPRHPTPPAFLPTIKGPPLRSPIFSRKEAADRVPRDRSALARRGAAARRLQSRDPRRRARWSRVWEVERETVEGLRTRVDAILRDEPTVSAILCANDVLALGAIQAAKQAGRPVPSSLSIIGFDDFDFAPTSTPPHHGGPPRRGDGGRAAELLLAYLNHGQFDTSEVVFPTRLIHRASA